MKEYNELYKHDFSDRILSEEDAKEIVKIEKEFLESYVSSKDSMSVEEWLPTALHNQLPEYSQEQIKDMSEDIIGSLKITENMKVSQQDAIKMGRSKESWFASTIMQNTSQMSAQESAKYLQSLDDAIASANEAMADTITTKAGLPNQNMNLDGFIAEQHHVNTYNMKSQSVGGDLYAEVLKPKPGETYGKNSVDIVIKNSSGKIVSRYQAKYGATAEETIRMINHGDYRGQQLLVPEEQVEAVRKAFPDRQVSSTIGDGDISSKPLSKEQAKELQKEAQKGNFLDADWNDYVGKDIAIGIGKQAGYACLQGAAIGAGMKIATKVWNGEKIDGEEVIETAIVSGADFGVKTATAGALKAASEKGILKVIPKGTKGSTFANIAFVAIENVKIVGKIAKGEYTAKEGLDAMEQTTCACVAGIAASAKGTVIGATVGSVLGPIGAAVGGFIGGTIGYMAGSKVGELVVKGIQKVREVAVSAIKSVATKAVGKAKSFGRAIASVFGF